MIPKYQVGRCWGCGCELVIGGGQVAHRASGNCPSFERFDDYQAEAERDRRMERHHMIRFMDTSIKMIRAIADAFVQLVEIQHAGTYTYKSVQYAQTALSPARAVADEMERFIASCLATPTTGERNPER